MRPPVTTLQDERIQIIKRAPSSPDIDAIRSRDSLKWSVSILDRKLIRPCDSAIGTMQNRARTYCPNATITKGGDLL